MNNKIIILLVFIALNILILEIVDAKTVTVDISGSCNYASIQDAINSNIDNDGNYIDRDFTIIVYPGIYNESLILSYPLNLKAYSSNPTDTVIRSEECAINLSGRALFLSGRSFLISGFTITGSDKGIYDSVGSESGENPVNIIIENNVITDGIYGVYLYGDFVSVKNNTFQSNNCGLYLKRCSPTEVIENQFISNNKGLSLEDSCDDVKNNLFTKNKLAISSLYGAHQIIGNRIQENSAGISMQAGSSLIASNTIIGNVEYGIENFQFDTIYNNYFCNELNLNSITLTKLNIEPCIGPNIVRGPSIGGNFWGKPDGTGFSQTHADINKDGFCDEPYIFNNYSIDYLPLKEISLPVANFTTNATEGYVPLSVNFIDLSENTTQWNWDFGDGTNATEQNVSHTYTSAGNYTVTLTVYNAAGSDSEVKTEYIRVSAPETSDTTSPVIDSLVLFPANTTAGSKTSISVNASDNMEVTEVTAGNVTLVKDSNGIWQGSITAPSKVGSYSLLIKANDAAGNSVETSASYKVVQLSGSSSVTVSPKISSVTAGSNVTPAVIVKNTQSIDDIFKVWVSVSELPASSQANLIWFDWTEKSVRIRAGEEVTLPIQVNVPNGTAIGRKLFRVNVKSKITEISNFNSGYLTIT
jgi:parallel beta-helix repeat protein